MLRRADRALLMAKENGRNQVVQLGSGMNGKPDEPEEESGKPSGKSDQTALVEQTLVTPVPTKMAIEKLRGFVADHQATIVKIDGNQIQLEITDRGDARRRLTDRPVVFNIDLRFEEQRARTERENGEISVGGVLRTRIFVSITPRKARDRRRTDAAARAQQVLISFRSYLMATAEEPDGPPEGALVKMKHVLLPWLGKKK
jgi:hypothetical protein